MWRYMRMRDCTTPQRGELFRISHAQSVRYCADTPSLTQSNQGGVQYIGGTETLLRTLYGLHPPDRLARTDS